MKKIEVLIAGFVAALFFASGAFAAAFIKYDGVDGESKSASDRPTEEVAFYYNKIEFSKMTARVGGPLIVKDEKGKTHVLKQDGRYSLSNGGHVWVKNGRVVKNTGHEMSHNLGVSSSHNQEEQNTRVPAGSKMQTTNNLKQLGTAAQPTGGAAAHMSTTNNLKQIDPMGDKPESSPGSLHSGQTEQPASLLVPAVQKVRSSPSRSSGKSGSNKGNVETEFNVEKGEK